MRPTKNAWPQTPGAETVKFFAQLMQEMLRPDAFESFRAYSLDTIARLNESMPILDDVARQRLPAPTLEPILKELHWSLGRDPVAGSIVRPEIRNFEEVCKDTKKDIRAVKSHIVLIQRKLSSRYLSKIENLLIELQSKPKEKNALRVAASIYCAHLINTGYSKAHLSATIEEHFFSKPMTRAGASSLRSLFKKLDGKDRRFRVTCAISDGFSKYISKLPDTNVHELTGLSQHARQAVQGHSGFLSSNKYLVSTIIAKDEFRAGQIIENYLNSARAMTYLSRYGVNFEWNNEKYVSRIRAASGLFVGDDQLRFQKSVIPTGRRIRAIIGQSYQILDLFSEPSTERLLSSINTSALARSSVNLENRLISLWSAVEVLLSEPPLGTPRIVHYVEAIVPCICLKYVRRYITAIYEEFIVGYRRRLTTILDKLPKLLGIDPVTRFTHLVFNSQYAAQLRELFDACADNPLALHRLWKLNKDFCEPSGLLSALKAHEDRVHWQVHRIYRARNQLVHAGKVPNYLESLALNAFEYYRSAINSILGQANKDRHSSEIDQVVAEIVIEYTIYKKSIQAMEKTAFTPHQFSTVFR